MLVFGHARAGAVARALSCAVRSLCAPVLPSVLYGNRSTLWAHHQTASFMLVISFPFLSSLLCHRLHRSPPQPAISSASTQRSAAAQPPRPPPAAAPVLPGGLRDSSPTAAQAFPLLSRRLSSLVMRASLTCKRGLADGCASRPDEQACSPRWPCEPPRQAGVLSPPEEKRWICFESN